MPMSIRDIVALAPVIPELTLTDASQAVPLARALCAAGLRVWEINVRTAVAIGCIESMRQACPQAIIGAGGLTRAVDFAAAERAGAQFASTAGLTPDLASAARGARFPVLPAVLTPTEIITVRNAGFNTMKQFPAEACGGIGMLQALAVPFADLLFCPAGCISQPHALDYLALPNVACVFGSWMIPRAALAAGDWAAIESLAREAAALGKTR
jgi:2-dehydro-3-deoxyphosphogluconate aldolase / (4S)-4-hydroxy-2-oxoglutarate aldolase